MEEIPKSGPKETGKIYTKTPKQAPVVIEYDHEYFLTKVPGELDNHYYLRCAVYNELVKVTLDDPAYNIPSVVNMYANMIVNKLFILTQYPSREENILRVLMKKSRLLKPIAKAWDDVHPVK
jgi:hypothetical protein